jgi:DNA-binding MarR family transcriptional regulator
MVGTHTMAIADKKELQEHVATAIREYDISAILFRNAVVGKAGVNVTDMECLGLLFHKKQATPKQLAEYTGLTSGSTTAMLDRLQKAKLIKREPNPNDRRGTLVTIDEKGAKKIGPFFQAIRSAEDALLASCSEEELWVLADTFQKFIELYKQERKALQDV